MLIQSIWKKQTLLTPTYYSWMNNFWFTLFEQRLSSLSCLPAINVLLFEGVGAPAGGRRSTVASGSSDLVSFSMAARIKVLSPRLPTSQHTAIRLSLWLSWFVSATFTETSWFHDLSPFEFATFMIRVRDFPHGKVSVKFGAMEFGLDLISA